MTGPSDPTLADGLPRDPYATPEQPGGSRHRPWAWIAACIVLGLVALGVTIWALNLNSDLDHQRDQTAAAQQQADKASSDVDQLTQDVNDALDQAGQAGAAAKDKLQGALADLKERLGALEGESKPPAGGAGESVTTLPAPTATVVENATPDGR